MGFISDLFSSPKPPPPVDFGDVGQQQAATNVETARIGARLARPDVVTPYTTTTLPGGPHRINIWRPRPWPSRMKGLRRTEARPLFRDRIQEPRGGPSGPGANRGAGCFRLPGGTDAV